MEILSVALEIQKKIEQLDILLKSIKGLAQRRAETIAEYDKQVGIYMARIRNGEEMELHGHMVQGPQATLIEKMAKSFCADHLEVKELADTEYALTIKALDVVRAQLNGWQSINRYLEHATDE